MMTNTYLPHVGGVARSVSFFVYELRKRGHEVLVVAPEYQEKPEEEDVLRIPAWQNFNGSDFSVILGTPRRILDRIKKMKPNIIHSHHPFLLGSAALRTAARFQLPLVFTHHTMYEQYTHYVPGNFPKMRQFVTNLSTGYANLCNQVIAPSQSIAETLRNRGVQVPISVIPTGIETERFNQGDPIAWREHFGIKQNAKVIGFISRLAPEKNPEFLAQAVTAAIKKVEIENHFLVVGDGPSQSEIAKIFGDAGISERLHFTGKLQGKSLVNAYHAMDIFAFASKTETQGLVLAEAMAAGLPVVALDAPGAREVVEDSRNGILLKKEDKEQFAEAIIKLVMLPERELENMQHAARKRAEVFSAERCVEELIELYEKLPTKTPRKISESENLWRQSVESLKAEWDLLSNYTEATVNSFKKNNNPPTNQQNQGKL